MTTFDILKRAKAAWPALARDWLQRRFALEIPDV